MNAQDLKNSILQRAIEGKLVPQRAEEGTARDLLAEIHAEKEKLIREKKIKKTKPLPEISNDEKPFDIPKNWAWVRLFDITSAIGDGIHGTPQYSQGGKYYFINGNNLQNDKIVIKKDTKTVDVEEANKYLVDLNQQTLLVSINGTLGNTAFYNNENVVLGKSACYINLLSKINKEYICYLVKADYFMKYAFRIATGTTIKNVSLKAIKNLLIPLPPLAEQHRIVARIKELQPDIDAYDKAHTELRTIEQRFPDDMKKSLLQYAIEGKLVPQRVEEGTARDLLAEIRAEKEKLIREKKIKKTKPLPEISDDEKPFEIPESWEWVRLNDIVTKDIKRGKSPTYTVKSNVLVFAQKCNTKKGYIDLALAKFLDKEKFKKYPSAEYMIDDDIVINSTGTGTLGRVGFFLKKDLGSIIVPDSHVTIIRTSKNVYAKYIFYVLKLSQNIFERMGEGSTKQKELRPSSLAKYILPIPPLAEQHRIVARLEELLSLCRQLAGEPE